jgi:hypothetical protein
MAVMSDWSDPWQWSAYRRMRRGVKGATLLQAVALIAFLPAGWILMMPRDPVLRPDLHRGGAWIVLAVCVALLLTGLRWSARARAAFETATEERVLRLRELASAAAIDLDIEIPDTYPPVLLSRRFRKIGFAGPDSLILSMDPVEVTATGRDAEGDGPRHPHVTLRFQGSEPERVHVAPGAIETSLAQCEILAERLRDQLDPRISWDRAEGPGIDMTAFIDSMRRR